MAVPIAGCAAADPPTAPAAASSAPAPSPSGSATDDAPRPAQLYSGDCARVAPGADALGAPTTVGVELAQGWTITVPTLGGLECMWSADGVTLVLVALPAQVRPAAAPVDGVRCSTPEYCTIDATAGDAWFTGWAVDSAGSDSASGRLDTFVNDVVMALVADEFMPADAEPVDRPTPIDCADTGRIAELEDRLDVGFSYAGSGFGYAEYAPAISDVALARAPECGLEWQVGSETVRTFTTVVPGGAWVIAEAVDLEAMDVQGAHEAGWQAPADAQSLGIVVARHLDDLLIVETTADVEAAAAIAAAVLAVDIAG